MTITTKQMWPNGRVRASPGEVTRPLETNTPQHYMEWLILWIGSKWCLSWFNIVAQTASLSSLFCQLLTRLWELDADQPEGEAADLRSRRPASSTTGWQSPARYGGASPCRHLLTSIKILYFIRMWTGSQCKSHRIGVMWSNLHVPVINRAAAFWTCSLWMTQSPAPTSRVLQKNLLYSRILRIDIVTNSSWIFPIISLDEVKIFTGSTTPCTGQ